MTNSFYVSDFGIVELSEATMSRLDAIDKGWRELYFNKRKRSRRAKEVRGEVEDVYTEIVEASRKAWESGTELKVF